MSADQPIQVVLRTTIVAFDGRVLELFGHRDAQRVHALEITAVDSGDDKITLTTRNQMDYEIVLNDGDEALRGDLDKLIDTVRRASPNVDGS